MYVAQRPWTNLAGALHVNGLHFAGFLLLLLLKFHNRPGHSIRPPGQSAWCGGAAAHRTANQYSQDSGTIMYINVYFRRVLQILRWLPPGLRTRCVYD